MPVKPWASGYNNLTLAIYLNDATTGANTTVRVPDPDNLLVKAQDLTFSSVYPGGLFANAQFFVPVSVTRAWPFKQGQRLVIRNGSMVVWEGVLVNPGRKADGQTMGRVVNASGYWGQMLGQRGWRRQWADIRITPETWVEQTAATAFNLVTLNRQSQIKFTPKAVGWTNGVYAAVRYTAPTGMTIQRVKWTHNMSGTNFNCALYNVQTAANEVLVVANGTVAHDTTLGTPSQSVELRQIITANRTPAADGTEAVIFTGITVYVGGSADVTASQVVTDWISRLAGAMTSDATHVAPVGSGSDNTLALVPWLSGNNGDYEMASANLARVASLGDASYNPWACYVTEAADGSAVPYLNYQKYLPLTGYDYTLRLTDQTLQGYGLNETDVFNWIVISYRDLNGYPQWISPDDDATLTDAASVLAYGRHEKVLTGNFTSAAAAANYARRFLASNKDRHFYVSQPIPVQSFILGVNGPVPVSQIRPGKRIRIVSAANDEIGLVGAGLTFTITGTSYSDVTETCQISTGIPDNTAVLLARLAQGMSFA